MKIIKSILLIIFISTLVQGQSLKKTTFPQIKFDKFLNLIEGHWKYDYSFNNDSTFIFDGIYYQNNPCPEYIEFNKTSKKADKQLIKDYNWLFNYRQTSCMKDFNFWVDYKGFIRYPKLLSDKVDSQGNLLSCRIELANHFDIKGREYISIVSVTDEVLVITNLKLVNNERENTDYHVFKREK